MTEFSNTTVQHNMAHQLNIGTFLPKGYHHLISQTGTQHRKRLEMTQGVHSWQTGHQCLPPQSAQLWFSLMCHNHSSHHHNPSQPGLLLLGCINLQLHHSTLFNWLILFFLLSQIAPALFYSQQPFAELHKSE